MTITHLCLFFLLLVASIQAKILDSKDCPLPRVRYDWRNMGATDRQNYLKAVNLLKTTKEIPYPGYPTAISIYDMYTQVHNYKGGLIGSPTVYAHGTEGFLAFHRYYLWSVETAMRDQVTITNAKLMAIKNDTNQAGLMDACVSIPFWSWENDYKNELNSPIFGTTTFGTNKAGCVTTGAFAGWKGYSGPCLSRNNNPNTYGGLHNSAAGIASVVANTPVFADYNLKIRNQIHGDPHLFIAGNMAQMYSPDDPLFYSHHANVDKLWALWQDCYDYDKVDIETARTNPQIHTLKWTISMSNGTIYKATYTNADPMPYFLFGLNPNQVPTRLNDGPRPIDMLSLGTEDAPGFKGLYLRYGPDTLVQTMKAKFSQTCNFDSNLVDYYPPSLKRADEVEEIEYNGTAFNDPKQQETLDRINGKFKRHPDRYKLKYMCLNDCQIKNRDPKRNYSTPTNWLAMNNMSPKDWLDCCMESGYLNGYEPYAYLMDSQFADQPIEQTWLLPFIIVLAAVVIIGVISLVGLYLLQKKRNVDISDEQPYKQMIADDANQSLEDQ